MGDERKPGPTTPEADAEPADRRTLWAALVEGRWSVCDRFRDDEGPCLVARRNPEGQRRSRALSPVEREVVRHAARGSANKAIAFAIGLACSSVATHLAAAMRKLGVTTRTELVALLGALAPEELGDLAGGSGRADRR